MCLEHTCPLDVGDESSLRPSSLVIVSLWSKKVNVSQLSCSQIVDSKTVWRQLLRSKPPHRHPFCSTSVPNKLDDIRRVQVACLGKWVTSIKGNSVMQFVGMIYIYMVSLSLSFSFSLSFCSLSLSISLSLSLSFSPSLSLSFSTQTAGDCCDCRSAVKDVTLNIKLISRLKSRLNCTWPAPYTASHQ